MIYKKSFILVCAVLSTAMQGAFSIPQFSSVADFSTIAKHKKGLGITVAGLASLVLADRALKNSLVILDRYLNKIDPNIFQGYLTPDKDWTYTTNQKMVTIKLDHETMNYIDIDIIKQPEFIESTSFNTNILLHPYTGSHGNILISSHSEEQEKITLNEISFFLQRICKESLLFNDLLVEMIKKVKEDALFRLHLCKSKALNVFLVLFEANIADEWGNQEFYEEWERNLGLRKDTKYVYFGKNWYGKILTVIRDRIILFDQSRVVRFKALLDYISSRMRRV